METELWVLGPCLAAGQGVVASRPCQPTAWDRCVCGPVRAHAATSILRLHHLRLYEAQRECTLMSPTLPRLPWTISASCPCVAGPYGEKAAPGGPQLPHR